MVMVAEIHRRFQNRNSCGASSGKLRLPITSLEDGLMRHFKDAFYPNETQEAVQRLAAP